MHEHKYSIISARINETDFKNKLNRKTYTQVTINIVKSIKIE